MGSRGKTHAEDAKPENPDGTPAAPRPIHALHAWKDGRPDAMHMRIMTKHDIS